MADMPKEKKKRKIPAKLVIFAIPVLLVIVAAVFVLGPGSKLIGGGKEQGKKAKEAVELPEAVVDLGDFVVNLSVEDDNQPRYAKVTVALAVDSEATAEYVKVREAFFKDAIVERFSQANIKELNKMEGRIAIRRQLLLQFADMMPEDKKIEKVLFTQLAFQ